MTCNEWEICAVTQPQIAARTRPLRRPGQVAFRKGTGGGSWRQPLPGSSPTVGPEALMVSRTEDRGTGIRGGRVPPPRSFAYAPGASRSGYPVVCIAGFVETRPHVADSVRRNTVLNDAPAHVTAPCCAGAGGLETAAG